VLAQASSLFEADAMVSFSHRSGQRAVPSSAVNSASLRARERQLWQRSKDEAARESAAAVAASAATGSGAASTAASGRSPASTAAMPKLAPLPEVEKPQAVTIRTLMDRQAHVDASTPQQRRRLMRELVACQTTARNPSICVYPQEGSSLYFWHVLIKAPDETPYANRWYQLYARFPSDYPSRPPEVRFVRPLVHVNVNAEGRICHAVFGSSYTSDQPISSVLGHVWQRTVQITEPNGCRWLRHRVHALCDRLLHRRQC
jgi:ubiquitin-protein ligase